MGMTFRVIEEDIWMRVKITGMAGLQDMMKLPKRWMLLDRTKLDDASGVPVYQNADPANTAAVIRTAETVEDRGDGTYAGFADLTANADIREASPRWTWPRSVTRRRRCRSPLWSGRTGTSPR
ncbi:hypothetical protein V2I01_09530 [Micromonospora sp. BRA006-A]|nr:hypothetical protein [Micromonospora sp. BRA006-A]